MKKLLFLVCISALLLCFVSCSCEETVTVKFETYIDTQLSRQELSVGDLVSDPAVTLKRAGYNFMGWYNGDKKWDFGKNTVSEDITLTAKWEPYLSYVEIDGELFVAGCDLLYVTDVVIPESYNGLRVAGILRHAFADRKNIKSVVIPSTVVTIGEQAFFGCTQLEKIYAQAQSAPAGWDESLVNTDVEFVFGYEAE